MAKRELLDRMKTFSDRLMENVAELDDLRRQMTEVFEENARLRLENSKLREHMTQTKEMAVEKTALRGKEALEALYEEGFHICNEDYAKPLDSQEPNCLMCIELLHR